MKFLSKFKVLTITTICLFMHTTAIAQTTVTIYPGDDIQQKVDANVGNTIFILKAGTHRLQKVNPKTDNTFSGESGTILSGAMVLSTWRQEGVYWVADNMTAQGAQLLPNFCVSSSPMCHYPEDLYKNGTLLLQRQYKSGIQNGNHWFFDQINDKIYIKFNPNTESVELTVAPYAFGGSATNVTIQDITVMHYASPTQRGAIGDNGADSWTITGCDVKDNHGVGIHFTGNSIISNNKVHHNGQLGIKTRNNSIGALVEDNEVYRNKVQGYWAAMEGGGSKFARSTDLIIRGNYFHHNYGPGIWTDIDNDNVLIENNISEYNDHPGIFHEISFSATITCNTARYNNQNPDQGSGGNIYISNSSDVTVTDNIVVGGNGPTGNGITVKCVNRGSALYMANDITVSNNDITYNGTGGFSGLLTDSGCPGSTNVVFSNNNYHASNTGLNYFMWGARTNTGNFSWMQNTIGQETGSEIDTILTSDDEVSCSSSLSKILNNSLNEENKIRIYPNPVSNDQELIIERYSLQENTYYKVIDIMGKVRIEGIYPLGVSKLNISMNSLNSGIYLLALHSDGVILWKRIIKK